MKDLAYSEPEASRQQGPNGTQTPNTLLGAQLSQDLPKSGSSSSVFQEQKLEDVTACGRERCSRPSLLQPGWEGAKIERLLPDLPTVQLLRLAVGKKKRAGGFLSRGPRCPGGGALHCLRLDTVHADWWKAFCKQRQLILEAVMQRELELLGWACAC